MHSTEQKSSALLAHIISQTQSNIDFLVSQNYLRASDAAGILSKLADINASSATSEATNSPANDVQRDVEEVRNPVLSVAERMRQLNTNPSEREGVPERAASPPKAVMVPTRRVVPPPSRSQQAKAIWDYNADGSDPNDLSFRSGEIIEIISETNADWWTGRLPNGRQGLFPSNYVEKLPPPPPSSPMRSASPGRAPVPVPAPSFPTAGPGGYRTHTPTWQGPPQPYGYGNEKQHAVYAPPAPPPPQQYQPPPPPAPAPAPGPEKPSKFGGLGNTMATSAAGGLGFGAGAAVGSGIINSIF